MRLFDFCCELDHSLLKVKHMKNNIGNTDKIIRTLVATVIAVLYFTHQVTGILGAVLLAVSGIFILTSLINFCPLYTVLGISTKKNK